MSPRLGLAFLGLAAGCLLLAYGSIGVWFDHAISSVVVTGSR